MHKRHPNQIRSACERCRRQKLRCSRQTTSPSLSPFSAEEPCARCFKLGASCQQGPQRKVGRPSRKDRNDTLSSRAECPGLDHVNTPSTATSTETPVDIASVSMDESFVFDTGDISCDFQWAPAVSEITIDPELNFLDVDLFRPPNLDNQLALHLPNQSLTLPGPQKGLSLSESSLQSHFASLSKVNVEFHTAWTTLRTTDSATIGTLIECGPPCIREDQVPGKEDSLLLKILASSQAYVATIKALGRRFGCQQQQPPPPSSASRPPQHPPPSSQLQAILDSPTAFLVISCFTQLIKCLELMLDVVDTSLLADNSTPLPLMDASLAGIEVQDFSSRGVFYVELLHNLLQQTLAVLGVPVPQWERRRAKVAVNTGLLAEARYRKLVNDELGLVDAQEGEWTKRPGALFERLDICKDFFLERYLAA